MKVGDRVRYSGNFLRSVGILYGELPQATGKIVALKTYGQAPAIATVEWDRPNMPARVMVSNLRPL